MGAIVDDKWANDYQISSTTTVFLMPLFQKLLCWNQICQTANPSSNTFAISPTEDHAGPTKRGRNQYGMDPYADILIIEQIFGQVKPKTTLNQNNYQQGFNNGAEKANYFESGSSSPLFVHSYLTVVVDAPVPRMSSRTSTLSWRREGLPTTTTTTW